MKTNYDMSEIELKLYYEFLSIDKIQASEHLYSSLQYADTINNHLAFSIDYFLSGNQDIPIKEIVKILKKLHYWLMRSYYRKNAYKLYGVDYLEYPNFLAHDYFILAENISSVITESENHLSKENTIYLYSIRQALLTILKNEGFIAAFEAEARNTFNDLVFTFQCNEDLSVDPAALEKQLYDVSRKIEKRNLNSSCYYLGYCFEYGIGTEINLKKALKYYKKAIKFSIESNINHSTNALSALAKLYTKTGDYPSAIKQFEKGIELKDPYCLYHYALILLSGEIVPRDIERAKELLHEIYASSNFDQNIGEYSTIIDEKILNLFEDEDYYSPNSTKRKMEKMNSLLTLKSTNNTLISVKNKFDDSHLMKMTLPDNQMIETNYDAQLQKLFGKNLQKLNSKTVEMIVNTLILFSEFNEKPVLRDYSPLVLSLFKALEIELSINFYQNHIKYLDSTPPTKHVISEKCKKKGKLKTDFDDFTLGKINDIIFNSPFADQNDFKTGGFYYYFLNDYVSPLYKNRNGKYWFLYFRDICSDIATIRQKYRNPTVHYEPIVFEKALDCFDFFFYTTNIINRIVEYKK